MASSWSDSARGTALAKALAKLSGECDQVFFRRPGWESTGQALRSWAGGSTKFPLNCAGEMATQARLKPMPCSRWAISPPKEWPMTTGGEDSPAMISE